MKHATKKSLKKKARVSARPVAKPDATPLALQVNANAQTIADALRGELEAAHNSYMVAVAAAKAKANAALETLYGLTPTEPPVTL